MKMLRLRWIAALTAILFAGVALAEKVYYTTDIQPVTSIVLHYLNTAGQAVPVSAANPMPSTSGPNGYIAGNWYHPKGPTIPAVGINPGIGSLRCYPGYVSRTLTTSFLAVRLNILFVTGNMQLAIYANSTANRPTGNALVSTASIVTTTAIFSSSAAVLQLQGDTIYWFCSNTDNATSAAISVATSSLGYAQLTGDALGNSLVSNTAVATIGVSTAQAFGTWPDVTGATWAVISNATLPIIALNVGSVP